MDENATEAGFEAPPGNGAFPKVRIVIIALFGLTLLGALLGSSLSMALVRLLDWPETLLSGVLAPDAPPSERWPMRLLLAINHLFTFVFPGLMTVSLFYRTDRLRTGWLDYLGGSRPPKASQVLSGMLLLLVSFPLVLFLYNVGQDISWPEMFREMERQTADSVKGLLQMEHLYELAANLLLIAVLPAFGEELVFRGVLQRQLHRRISKPWLAILLAAGVFSFIHFQFEGFFARWLLGVLLGFLYWRTGNFWVPVAAHFFNNAIQVIGQYLYRFEVSAIDLEQDIRVPWTLALAALILVLLVCRMIDRQAAAVPQNEL